MRARLCFLILIAGWAGAAQSQSAGNPAMPCYRALADDPRFASIKDKVALGGGAAEEIRRVTSAARPAAEDKPTLAAWRSAREACHQKELPYYATRDTEIGALARRHFAAVQALIGDLQDGKLTYGEFSARRTALYEKVSREIEEVRRSILPPKPAPHPVGKQ